MNRSFRVWSVAPLSAALSAASAVLAASASLPAQAAPGEGTGYHPWAEAIEGPKRLDLREETRAQVAPEALVAAPVEQPAFWSLDEHETAAQPEPAAATALQAGLPEGWVQRGTVVLPEKVASGDLEVDPEVIFATAELPGNKYPRKHTLFLNFIGGMLLNGADNSAENRSSLARPGVYPRFPGTEMLALAVVQAVQNDLEPYGVRVLYDRRPSKTVPYTMEMMGGDWTNTNIDSPAGGVAPGADCGALGQRHVVYTFSQGASVNSWANVASQEAGHAWGLDHTMDCNSVMSYCIPGTVNGSFRSGCAELCEAQCQGPASVGCRSTHAMFCGDDSNQQDDHAEMTWLFGTNEPDLEPPTVEIESPADGDRFAPGQTISLRALVDDNYGGFGWKLVVERGDEVLYDQPAYDKNKEVDTSFRAAYDFSFDPGTYVLTIEAEDHNDHVTTRSVTVIVGDGTNPAAEDGEGSGGITDEESGGTEGSTTGGEADDAGDLPSGCAIAGVSASGTPFRGAYFAPILVLGLMRLRNRRKRLWG